MSRRDEDIVMRQEYELWKAAQKMDGSVFYKFFAPEVNVICNNFRCDGEEYFMTLSTFGMQRYSIERNAVRRNSRSVRHCNQLRQNGSYPRCLG